MLVKASAEDVKSFQAYTIRRLDQKQSSLTDSEHFKLINVKENAMSNKLKHLDVLCFPHFFRAENLVSHMIVKFPSH